MNTFENTLFLSIITMISISIFCQENHLNDIQQFFNDQYEELLTNSESKERVYDFIHDLRTNFQFVFIEKIYIYRISMRGDLLHLPNGSVALIAW
ncbi:MAG: hypothetical protein KC505_09960 [Myxococcales bacterium]|nr:hypothetical protein [Myxococcales bacterium]USN50929.1 MAG: hypothetical protein H6731_00485 [Myxococcales bacterium]